MDYTWFTLVLIIIIVIKFTSDELAGMLAYTTLDMNIIISNNAYTICLINNWSLLLLIVITNVYMFQK